MIRPLNSLIYLKESESARRAHKALAHLERNKFEI
jgi:hypothetical protein